MKGHRKHEEANKDMHTQTQVTWGFADFLGMGWLVGWFSLHTQNATG